jgi:hypothetical protein
MNKKYLVSTNNTLFEFELIRKSSTEKYWKVIDACSKDRNPFWVEIGDYSIIEALEEDYAVAPKTYQPNRNIQPPPYQTVSVGYSPRMDV